MSAIKQFLVDMLLIVPLALFMVACTFKGLEWEAERNSRIAEQHRFAQTETAKPIYINCHPNDDIADECYPVAWETTNEN